MITTVPEQSNAERSRATVEQEPIRLDFSDGGRPVVVCPADQDRFVTTSQQAAEACQQAYNLNEWRKQFHAMLFEVRQWAESCSAPVQVCFIAVREGLLVIFAVPTADSYDFRLADELTELDIRIANKCPLCRCEVMQIPGRPDQLSSFLDPTEALQVYGSYSGAHREVEA
jgi:hypothetical protein